MKNVISSNLVVIRKSSLFSLSFTKVILNILGQKVIL